VSDRRHRPRLEDRLYLARLGGRFDDDQHAEPRLVRIRPGSEAGIGP
jgi:hypothetical protein